MIVALCNSLIIAALSVIRKMLSSIWRGTLDDGHSKAVSAAPRIEKGWIEPNVFCLQSGGDVPRCRFCQMALSSASSHTELCDRLVANGAVKDAGLDAAWRLVDRADFCPAGSDSYADAAVFMGYGAQVSAPHVHARGVEMLANAMSTRLGEREPLRVLEVGSGCGFVSALLAVYLSMRRGTNAGDSILAVEHISELVDASLVNIKKHHPGMLCEHGGSLSVRCGDALKLSDDVPGGIDYIYSGCSFVSVSEGAGKAIFGLLKPGGCFVAPFGEADKPQILCSVEKLADGTCKIEKDITVLFVPAKDAAEQRHRGNNWQTFAEKRLAHFSTKLTQP